MRGDAAVTIRLALRGAGLAGLTAKVGGVVALIALAVPWHQAVTTVGMLGADSTRVEANAAALPGSWWGWVGAAAGAAAVYLGIGIAFDRPVRWARHGLVAAAAALGVAATAAFVAPPDLAALLGPDAAVQSLAERLPTGVTMRFEVRSSLGPWLTLAAAAVVGAGALGAREP